MKVLFLLSGLGVGGLETYLYRFLKFLPDNIDVTILCKGNDVGVLKNKFESLGVNVVHHKVSYISVRDYYYIYRFINQNRFDCVCDFTGYMSGLVMTTAYLCGVRTRIASYRESTYQFKPSWLKLIYARILKYLAYRFSTKVISNSEAGLSFFYPNYCGDKFKVIPNAIPDFQLIGEYEKLEIRNKIGIPHNALLIGHVGRFTAAKNHSQILKLFVRVQKKIQNIHLLFCGRDVENGLSIDGKLNNIHFIEHCDDVDKLIQCFDLFYFPSLNEGQPNALLEAMSVGVPIIASDIPSIKATVPLFMHKYLVSPNDIDTAESLLLDIISYRNQIPLSDMRNSIRQTFSSDKNFSMFLDEILL
ncbi:glycosyltransferase [Shewanella sp. ECSMB14102]|uniref:glycosyltransferase n=1 Tax=Shewanella sp. ECSMB14102 TaxID=1579504 RepID=UPI000579DB0A|nr:glycosyltransferase [Shewanella sp. ECSMB14102]